MKAATVLLLLFVLCYAECRKIYPAINKNANVDFINMESGGVRSKPAVVEPPKPVSQVTPVPTAKAPVQPSVVKPAPAPAPTPPPKPAQPQKPGQPVQIKPVPVNPSPVANPATTPGPGSVKSLINYYDSQGKGSPIRPYSYSQAVKQG